MRRTTTPAKTMGRGEALPITRVRCSIYRGSGCSRVRTIPEASLFVGVAICAHNSYHDSVFAHLLSFDGIDTVCICIHVCLLLS